MAPSIQVRSPEEWRLELQRLHRMARAAEIDVLHGAEWKAAVTGLVDALALLVTVSAEGEAHAVAAAATRLHNLVMRLERPASAAGTAVEVSPKAVVGSFHCRSAKKPGK